ncbi:UvrD-helicase domain-containing protein [uncultured Ilyobacter sp.]|uniref:UvrD-helicase domain-containing protein n=1 Tax=uncultured Ilyobacter sp. TaxID=544433 RepID=UPI002AA821A1|nr:UvrD-helicase domain-containing protein [uncultured Ilyobacter sp.]
MLKSGLKLFNINNNISSEDIKSVDVPNDVKEEGLLRFHPSSYNKMKLSSIEQKLIRNIKKVIKEGHVFINLNVINKDLSHVLISKNKLFFIYPIETNSLESFLNVKDYIYTEQLKKYRSRIKKRLLEHKSLRKNAENDKVLSFDFEVKYLLNLDITEKEVKELKLNQENLDYLKENIVRLDNFLDCVEGKVSTLKENDILNIIQMIAPEYTIPTKKSKTIDVKPSVQPTDIDVSSILLDEKQIRIINEIKSGHSLILASAGSGKSVILLSKALKIAAKNPDKEVILLCYNKNLASHYEWKISIAGFRAKNLKCLTFHKFLEKLLKDTGQSVIANKNKSDYFDEVFTKVQGLLEKGEIKNKYYGIFIDEIQIFRTEWYRLCYDLLENKAVENHFLTICGDISQNVNKNIKAGRAPWQGEGLPSFRGRSMRLTENYRNSQEITDFMNGFIHNVKDTIDRFSIEVENEEELFILGKSVRNGEKIRFIEGNRCNFIQKIIDEINWYNKEKNIPFSEIAVIFPYKEWKCIRYYLCYWLVKKLEEEYIDYSPIISTGNKYGKYYSQIEGVVLSTVESSLGLDFEAVIMTGFLPLGLRKNSKKIDRKKKGIDEETEQEFLSAVNKIYTGCTRARNNLTILTEESTSESIYVDFIKKSLNKEGNFE